LANQSQAPCAEGRADHVEARAVQVEQHRGAGLAVEVLVGRPQAVQLDRLAGLGGLEIHPHVAHALGGLGASPPAAVGGLEDPAALAFVEVGAAGEHGRSGQKSEDKAFHGEE
jgi:hypothetical protein